jgi:hypothetical protein
VICLRDFVSELVKHSVNWYSYPCVHIVVCNLKGRVELESYLSSVGIRYTVVHISQTYYRIVIKSHESVETVSEHLVGCFLEHGEAA